MKHKAVRVDNLMYKGCEPHWKCIHCGECVPFHCYSKKQFEERECKNITIKTEIADKAKENEMDREKLKELIKDSGEIASAVGMQEWVVEKIADHLIENGIGDITAEKHRADVAEEALRELIAERYENGIRPICNLEMLYEARLEQAEERLKEKKECAES